MPWSLNLFCWHYFALRRIVANENAETSDINPSLNQRDTPQLHRSKRDKNGQGMSLTLSMSKNNMFQNFYFISSLDAEFNTGHFCFL